MTAAARITEADFKRATVAAAKASTESGKPSRVIFRLEQREIEIIVGESGGDPAPDAGKWNDDEY